MATIGGNQSNRSGGSIIGAQSAAFRARGRRQRAIRTHNQTANLLAARSRIPGGGGGGAGKRQLESSLRGQRARMGIGGGSGGGGSLASEYQKALDKANAANDKRYQQTLGLRRGMERLNLKRTGQQEFDVRRSGQVQQSAMQQQLVTGGLSNTTVGIGRNTPIQRNTDAEVRRVRDDRLNTQLGLIEGRTGVIERKQDIGPDFNQLFAQQQALGRGGGGAGGGGGSGWARGYGRMMHPTFGNRFRPQGQSYARRRPLTIGEQERAVHWRREQQRNAQRRNRGAFA
jgi:hypothetical protein